MGSLMAGWDSTHIDPQSATLKRNRSLTKDEIDAYWKSKKKIEEEHLRAISNLSETIQASKSTEPEKKLQKSMTMPVTRARDYLNMGIDTSLEHLIKKNGWWTKSSWAFLNEPPVTEAVSNKYKSQFHVTSMGSSIKI
ncbi:hypothetical protein JHK82_039049 [Glycine max]|uniref:Uncharacterized protein n=1 Tax=Glycine max TaxID=3847 RepID=C6T3M6_SOYBN|nr:uncharacterized protein LOC100527212 [Glycine max]ACU16264.1 unknown [Glycine max]KAG5109826.1 hypothetical protein JHK82_039049 [Glycine max]KAG5121116.1 hypothetical protein JHK84_039456 [Glycine max]KAH1093473.1 hypothetical protein GYH30_039290 [Glycine max]KRH15176.1 hypothetical protein GLYMA_14G073200v4 [Glycine max]|eukprot:NP_001236475.1 uncharacterized protein LOC100527212 [Glycine max]